jgi:hypothetical protein
MAKVKEPATQLSVLNWFFDENCQLFKCFAKFKVFEITGTENCPQIFIFQGCPMPEFFFQSAKTAP